MTTNSVIGARFKISEMLISNPELPYSIIANEVGVTRERVRQIAKQYGFPQRKPKPKQTLKQKLCPLCNQAFNTGNKYCSHDCAKNAIRTRIVVICDQCGKSNFLS